MWENSEQQLTVQWPARLKKTFGVLGGISALSGFIGMGIGTVVPEAKQVSIEITGISAFAAIPVSLVGMITAEIIEGFVGRGMTRDNQRKYPDFHNSEVEIVDLGIVQSEEFGDREIDTSLRRLELALSRHEAARNFPEVFSENGKKSLALWKRRRF